VRQLKKRWICRNFFPRAGARFKGESRGHPRRPPLPSPLRSSWDGDASLR
jgi:hypothetical protein